MAPPESGPEAVGEASQAILTPPLMFAASTFWGTGPLKEFPAATAADCYTPCFGDGACTGGTFNPVKQYCWLRTGSGSIGVGLSSDSAFTVSSAQREALHLGLMSTAATFWGSGALREFDTSSASNCYLSCVNDASCSGGTYNPDKHHCWIRTGSGSIGVGLSSDYAFTVPSSGRNAHFSADMRPGVTFWGSGALREFGARSASECYLGCLDDASCTGATYNPDKQYCWLRTGSGSIGAGLSSDYAFTVAAAERDSYVQSLLGPASTFWGSGALRELDTSSASNCYLSCVNDPSCSGGTYNPVKQHCWLRTGSGSIGAGLWSDSSFTVAGEQHERALRSLAGTFAPRLRFDGAASNYPMSAQTFYDRIVATGSTARLENTDYTTIANGQVPTYYQVTECGNQVRIQYWWFYGYQPPCDQVEVEAEAHNGDWETVLVTLSEDRSKPAAVTFSAHKGRYTRLLARGGFDVEDGTHPVVYVGKLTHASYYNQGGSGTCLYWEDWRNNTNGRHMDTWFRLVSLDTNEEPWMLADRVNDFAWGSSGIHTHPTRRAPTCSEAACKWAAFNDAWLHSQCKYGDVDDGLRCYDWYNMVWYDYDYNLPTSDQDLLK
ncbi:MAG: PAN domain-containing protein [Minicystis sp.]